MTRWTRNDWIVLGSSAVATGMTLVATVSALAHEGHSHGEEVEAASPSPDEQPVPHSESAHDPPASSNTEAVDVPATATPLETQETPIEATSETPSSPAAVSQASATEGFSVGWGESLLGLIIAGPFLLLFLKKQIRA